MNTILLVINVGGVRFSTTKDTLCKCEFFKKLFEFQNTSEGIFVDRDPEGFKHVLRLLRNPLYTIPDMWISEWEYYQPPSYVFLPSPHDLLPSDGHMITLLTQESMHKSQYDPKYIDWIITLRPSIISDTKTVFDLSGGQFDEIRYPMVDYSTLGGVIHIGKLEIDFGGDKPFVRIYMHLVYRVVKIEFKCRLELLKMVVRNYLGGYKSTFAGSQKTIDVEKNLIYSGQFEPQFIEFPEPKWLRPGQLLREYENRKDK